MVAPARPTPAGPASEASMPAVAPHYGGKPLTNWRCPCGRVARKLRSADIEFAEVRVPAGRRDRDEVDELTGQRWVPVLVHGDDVVHDSHRIVEFVDYLESLRPAEVA